MFIQSLKKELMIKEKKRLKESKISYRIFW
jgi:hypothetical protein